MPNLTHGSLFSGIGGFDLGFERAGIQTLWQVENDPYAVKVLERHWPNVKRYGDIKAIEWEAVEVPDIVSGGFPCQPVSVAGKRRGADDERWLWPEFARCLRVLRPRYAVLENVPGLLALGFGDVLGDLAALGYDAEWDCIPAAAFGAPHLRYRVWVVAYAEGCGCERRRPNKMGSGRPMANGLAGSGQDVSNARSSGRGAGERDVLPGEPDAVRGGAVVADAEYTRPPRARSGDEPESAERRVVNANRKADVADASGPNGFVKSTERRQAAQGGRQAETFRSRSGTADVADANGSGRQGRAGVFGPGRRGELEDGDWWTTEPDVGRLVYGIPARVDRLKCLGNAIVPQIAEWLGRRIVEFDLAR